MSAFPPPVNQLSIYNPNDFTTEVVNTTAGLQVQLNTLTTELNNLTTQVAKIKANTRNYYGIQLGLNWTTNTQYNVDTGIPLVAGSYLITVGLFASYTDWSKSFGATTFSCWHGLLNCTNPDAVAVSNCSVTYTIPFCNTFFVTYATNTTLVWSHCIFSTVNPSGGQNPTYTVGVNNASPYNQNVVTGYFNVRCLS